MSDSVLVTWATRYGATEEVARKIAATLRQSGLEVETRPIQSVDSLDPYGAIVLGCALYMGRIHPDARRFLTAYRSALSQHPVALFVLGPVHRDEKEFQGARTQLAKELSRFPWLAPVSMEIFGGRWDPSKMGFPFSWLPGIRRAPISDARDWDTILKWAGTLIPVLHQPAAAR